MQPQDIPTTPILPTEPPKRTSIKLGAILSNKIFLLGIFVFVMLVLALTTQLASRSRYQEVESSVAEAPQVIDSDSSQSLTASWLTYQDPYNNYSLRYPPTWEAGSYSYAIEKIKPFTLVSGARVEIAVDKVLGNTLESHLETLDSGRGVAWGGKSSRSITRTSSVTIGDFPGYERLENISTSGVELLTAYLMVGDEVFTFALTPPVGEKTLSNQESVREFRLMLTTFELKDLTARLGEQKTYSRPPQSNLAYPSYSISFPGTWSVSEVVEEGSHTLNLSRSGYRLTISQSEVGSAVCLFKDSPAFQGSSGDLRGKDFLEFQTEEGYYLRRYFKENLADNSIFLFCGKSEGDTYFQTPLAVGGLTYTIPARYNERLLEEMDAIVQTLKPVVSE